MVSILISALIFILSVVLAWLAGPLLHVEGTSLLILRILLVLLGATAATIILVCTSGTSVATRPRKTSQGGSDMDTLLRDAEKRLAAAQRTGREIARFPPPALHSGRRQLGKDNLCSQIRARSGACSPVRFTATRTSSLRRS